MAISQQEIEQRAIEYMEWADAPSPKPDSPDWASYPWDLQTAEDAWPVILAILSKKPSDDAISVLAAGPLEDTISLWGKEFMQRIETEAINNQAFRELLGGVWKCGSPEIWRKIELLRGQPW